MNQKTSDILYGFKEGQKKFGETIAAIINTFLLSIVYFIGVGLTSLFAKLTRKNFLDTKKEEKLESYWEDLNIGNERKEGYYKQY